MCRQVNKPYETNIHQPKKTPLLRTQTFKNLFLPKVLRISMSILYLMYLSLHVSRNFSSWVGVIRSSWYRTLGCKKTRQIWANLKMRQNSVAGWRIAYLASAVVIDAVFVPGLLDSFRKVLDKFLNLLQVRVFKVRKWEAQVCLEWPCTPTHADCLTYHQLGFNVSTQISSMELKHFIIQ